MSSIILTAGELASSARSTDGRCWRFVEAQHRTSTLKLTDTLEEQRRLEEIIDNTKSIIPEDCRHLNFLLYTPFRYVAYPNGSRFRRAGLTAGVFYASIWSETAATEMAFHRLLFYAESPATPWPLNAAQYTSFEVAFSTQQSIDLTRDPFHAHADKWTHPVNYDDCQALADLARTVDINLIKYKSVRAADGVNVAVLTCSAFANNEPLGRETWHIHLSASGIRLLRESPSFELAFGRNAFSADPRVGTMKWDRS
jgi:hypothetical protein